jgi:hypothetical protein
MRRDEDIFTVTKRLASLLRWASVPPSLLGLLSLVLAGSYVNPRKVERETLIGIGIAMTILGLGVLHQIAAAKVLELRRWGMHVAMTLAACWTALATCVAVLAVFAEPGVILFAVLVGWGGIYGIALTRLSLQRLNEDDGWSTDEPPRPKGFEPVLPAITSPTPSQVREPPVPPARADS